LFNPEIEIEDEIEKVAVSPARNLANEIEDEIVPK
jgi:hypothetical protein